MSDTAVANSNKDKRSFAVFRSDAEGTKGSLISNAKSKQWNKVAKKFAFKNAGEDVGETTWVLVELRAAGRGKKPTKLYQLKREMRAATPSYKAIAEARKYKNVDMMPWVSIIGKAKTVVPNKRRVSSKKAAQEGESGSKSSSRSRSRSPAHKVSSSKSRSASPAPAKKTKKAAAAGSKSPKAKKQASKKTTSSKKSTTTRKSPAPKASTKKSTKASKE